MGDKKATVVLLLEEGEEAREAIKKIIESEGFLVVATGTGQEAVEIYNTHSEIDCIVSELIIPYLSGGDFAEHNFKHKKLPFIAISGYSKAVYGLKLLEFGVHDYIVKPATRHNLIPAIKGALLGEKREKRGNLSTITLPVTMEELGKINGWIIEGIKEFVADDKRAQFLNYVAEFLLNSLEHGALGIGEQLKSTLLEKDSFELEVGLRENIGDNKITVSLSAIKGEVALSIADNGKGFDYKKYTLMTDVELVSRIDMINGRGIIMGRSYFDTLEYFDGGRKVTIAKRFPICETTHQTKVSSDRADRRRH